MSRLRPDPVEHRAGGSSRLSASLVDFAVVSLLSCLCVFAPWRETFSRPLPALAAELGVEGTRFTVDRKPTFLLGISYYGALGASPETLRRDLDDAKRLGFNWIRVWATWSAFGDLVSAVGSDGTAREPFFSRLRELVAECDRRGMLVDVTLSRGNGVSGAPRLQALREHGRAVETLVTGLKPFRNWYLDLGNERNIRDKRFVDFEELEELRELARRLDAKRLVTASHAGDLSAEELKQYLDVVAVDFLAPHRPRDARSPGQTAERTRQYLRQMKNLGRIVPVHYQEPFRRGFSKGWDPSAEDFVTDALAARDSGAAGWCFHNGDARQTPDGRPRRSFDVRHERLFDQLDAVERKAVEALARSFLQAKPQAAAPGRKRLQRLDRGDPDQRAVRLVDPNLVLQLRLRQSAAEQRVVAHPAGRHADRDLVGIHPVPGQGVVVHQDRDLHPLGHGVQHGREADALDLGVERLVEDWKHLGGQIGRAHV